MRWFIILTCVEAFRNILSVARDGMDSDRRENQMIRTQLQYVENKYLLCTYFAMRNNLKMYHGTVN